VTHDEIINARYEYALLAQRDESVEYGVSPGLVIELIDWLRTAREELAAMTEDRDLWRYDHEGDCPVQAALEAEREARKQAEEALRKIADWELPSTGETWPSGGPVSYEANFGSNGVRDYIRSVARAALEPVSGSPQRLEVKP
jgi:hypothetical protein